MTSRADRSRARREAGFTLIEMLVVLAVLGMALGLVLGRPPSRSPAVELRAAATSLAGVLRLARSQAIAGNRRVVVTLDLAAWVVRVDAAGAADTAFALPRGIDVSLNTAAGEAAGPQRGGIGFAPDGSSSGGRIILTAAGGTGLAVAVDWLSGRVTVVAAGAAPDAR